MQAQTTAGRRAAWQTGPVAHLPVEPPGTAWVFPCTAEEQAALAGAGEVVGTGADLEPATLLAAYRCGLFPMPVGNDLAWWSPDPRGVIPLDGLLVPRSLRRSCRRYEIRIDSDFESVVTACADPRRRGRWINRRMFNAYVRMHELGWAHSVEAWTPEGELAGGLYGVAIGGFFAGESMFHRYRDASKVALVALVAALSSGGALLDVQWPTAHLASLGAVAIGRDDYLGRLQAAVTLPPLSVWAR